MAAPYAAKEMTYLTADRKHTRKVFHPAIKLPGNRVFCYFPDEGTQSGLIEYENAEDALSNAIDLYRHYAKVQV